MDPYRPSDDPDDPPARDNATGEVQRVPRQRDDVVTARQSSAAGGPRLLHVSGQHQPHD